VADGKLAAALDEIRERERAAAAGPWSVAEEFGWDISDEAWSDYRIVSADGTSVGIFYLTDVIEPDAATENAEFAVGARTDVPRLLAALDEVVNLASGWEANCAQVPVLSREAAAIAVRGAVFRALCREEGCADGG
jgi:hypothetical protein